MRIKTMIGILSFIIFLILLRAVLKWAYSYEHTTPIVTKKPFKYMGFNGKAYARGRGKVSLKRALRIRK